MTDRTCAHVVGVAVNGYGFEDKAEHGAAFEAALRHSFNDSPQGLGSCGHDYPAIYLHGPGNRGAEMVARRAQFRAHCVVQPHGDYGPGGQGDLLTAEDTRCRRSGGVLACGFR